MKDPHIKDDNNEDQGHQTSAYTTDDFLRFQEIIDKNATGNEGIGKTALQGASKLIEELGIELKPGTTLPKALHLQMKYLECACNIIRESNLIINGRCNLN